MSLRNFFKQASETDMASSLAEEHVRYANPPNHGKANIGRWWLLWQASKYEFLPRQQWMTQDKYEKE